MHINVSLCIKMTVVYECVLAEHKPDINCIKRTNCNFFITLKSEISKMELVKKQIGGGESEFSCLRFREMGFGICDAWNDAISILN